MYITYIYEEATMPQPLAPETIAIIKATAPALQQHGLAITTRMYALLFEDPAMKVLFDQAAQSSGEQPKRLAGAILAFARNVDNLAVLSGALEGILAGAHQLHDRQREIAERVGRRDLTAVEEGGERA